MRDGNHASAHAPCRAIKDSSKGRNGAPLRPCGLTAELRQNRPRGNAPLVDDGSVDAASRDDIEPLVRPRARDAGTTVHAAELQRVGHFTPSQPHAPRPARGARR